MRETAGLPAGILLYVTAMVLILLTFQNVFIAPQNWSRFITSSTSAVSFLLACRATEKFSTSTGVKIVAVFIALFWIIILGIDVTQIFSEILGTLEGSNKTAADTFIKFVEAVWNSKICAGVTGVLALWTVSK